MLAKSDMPITPVLARFTAHDLETSFLVPTATGLDKSILDAVGPLRDFLKRRGFHDYALQEQGPKRRLRAFFVYPDRLSETTVSLYRPETKAGDPRIWFYGLSEYAKPFNLLAILCESHALYVVNASRAEILDSIRTPGSPLSILAQRHDALSAHAIELLEMLRKVSRKGFVKSLRRGDTGVGFTLESHLGIRANVSRAPDFKGIEIKASRKSGGNSRENRITLFSQVPNWRKSKVRNGKELLEAYGYERSGRLQLYCTVSSQPNSQGLYFDISDGEVLWNRATCNKGIRDVACWDSSRLVERLLEKHPSTMWVKARSRGDREAGEEFHFVQAIFTKNPVPSSLLPLIEDGTVTMDYTLSLRESGSARDHGYLFKIPPDELPSLFPPPRAFDLTTS